MSSIPPVVTLTPQRKDPVNVTHKEKAEEGQNCLKERLVKT